MKKARLIFLASLIFMAFSAFKGNPHAPDKKVQPYNFSGSAVAEDSLNIR